jgi:hypothetical protein
MAKLQFQVQHKIYQEEEGGNVSGIFHQKFPIAYLQ